MTKDEYKDYKTIQFRIKPLIFEFLKEDAKRFDLSPHQLAQQLMIQQMIDRKMLPSYNLVKLCEDVLFHLGKRLIKDIDNGK